MYQKPNTRSYPVPVRQNCPLHHKLTCKDKQGVPASGTDRHQLGRRCMTWVDPSGGPEALSGYVCWPLWNCDVRNSINVRENLVLGAGGGAHAAKYSSPRQHSQTYSDKERTELWTETWGLRFLPGVPCPPF